MQNTRGKKGQDITKIFSIKRTFILEERPSIEIT